jgi:hydrogenase maturation factor
MTVAPAIACDHEHGCITCGDEAKAIRALALCEDEDGVRSTVEIALVEPIAEGATLLVHAGTALQVLA